MACPIWGTDRLDETDNRLNIYHFDAICQLLPGLSGPYKTNVEVLIYSQCGQIPPKEERKPFSNPPVQQEKRQEHEGPEMKVKPEKILVGRRHGRNRTASNNLLQNTQPSIKFYVLDRLRQNDPCQLLSSLSHPNTVVQAKDRAFQICILLNCLRPFPLVSCASFH